MGKIKILNYQPQNLKLNMRTNAIVLALIGATAAIKVHQELQVDAGLSTEETVALEDVELEEEKPEELEETEDLEETECDKEDKDDEDKDDEDKDDKSEDDEEGDW